MSVLNCTVKKGYQNGQFYVMDILEERRMEGEKRREGEREKGRGREGERKEGRKKCS